MDKVIFVIFAIILAGLLFYGWQSGFFAGLFSGPLKPVQVPEGIILFYGQGCSHCKVVDDFIAKNNIEEKISFTRMEVWYNKNNQNILAQVVQKCGLNMNEVGVPFLYDGAECLIGDIDVIDFFKNEAGIK